MGRFAWDVPRYVQYLKRLWFRLQSQDHGVRLRVRIRKRTLRIQEGQEEEVEAKDVGSRCSRDQDRRTLFRCQGLGEMCGLQVQRFLRQASTQGRVHPSLVGRREEIR